MNAIIKAPPPASHGLDRAEMVRVLGNSLYPGAKPESIELVLSYCRVNGLDPMLKPVHIVPTSVKLPNGRYEMRDVLMPGIADYRIKAARSGEYGGKSEPEFGPDVTQTMDKVTVTYPAWCRITVKRIVQGQAREFTANERWLENYATGRDTTAPNRMWLKRAYGQLAKCAESQALRMAFPEFSGGYTAEEMEGKTGGGDFAGMTLEAEISDAIPERVMQAPPPPKRTARDWLADMALRLAGAADLAALDAIVVSPEVKRVADRLTNGALEEWESLLAENVERLHETPHDPETGELGDS